MLTRIFGILSQLLQLFRKIHHNIIGVKQGSKTSIDNFWCHSIIRSNMAQQKTGSKRRVLLPNF